MKTSLQDDPVLHRWIVWPHEAEPRREEIGGKAGALAALASSALPIPAWFAIAPHDAIDGAELAPSLLAELDEAVQRLAPDGALLAVRSSAREEDGAEHSFAGQFESYLFVRAEDVAARVHDVWRTALNERVAAYRRESGIEVGGHDASAVPPAVLVQRMIEPVSSGVAFSADPVSGRRGICVVSATWGVGTALVSGDVDADSWHVDRAKTIANRRIVKKDIAHQRGAHGLEEYAVDAKRANAASLTDAQVLEVAALARAAESYFGRPQDIEWAIDGDTLWLLQSRPVTSLAALPDPDGALAIWDNSNITESYGGVTTPLTFSFARYVYEEVYRQFCRIVGVRQDKIDANADALRAMLGLVRGRVYYNLVSWYRTLALLPGYRLNRSFMEQMMGVREPLPPEVESRIGKPSRSERLGDAMALARTIVGLVRAHRRLPRDIREFQARLDRALASDAPLSSMRPDELVTHYRSLERALLRRWDAPLVNDFFAMVFFGLLKKLATGWCGDAAGSLQNDLVAGEGAIVSAEPAMRIATMAKIAAVDPELVRVMGEESPSQAMAAIDAHPALAREFHAYLDKFGDRCLEELKLETRTLNDDPMLLVRSVATVAAAHKPAAARAERIDIRGEAERRAFDAIGNNNFKRAIFAWVLRNARERVRDRENLRFERTRVFGRVRRIVLELGRRFAAVGALDDPRDVFHLTIDEVLGWCDATSASADLRAIARVRRNEFDGYRRTAAPADRFETRGLVHVGHDFLGRSDGPTRVALDGEQRTGIGCYPGIVRGRVRVVRDPRNASLEAGEILVAERTDPGWVMLFPIASALLVERGSLLSHSAIVARELGLPAVVSIEGLTSWLATGDEVELDGRTGVVRRLER